MKGKAVILLSGGLDSTTLLHYLARRIPARRICALTFNYGQKHFDRELACARWQARRLGTWKHLVVDISVFARLIGRASSLTSPLNPVPDYSAIPADKRSQPPTYVPNRNMIIIALACAHAEALGIYTVYYAAQAQDFCGYWDCTRKFIARMNGVLSLNRRRAVVLEAPFAGLGKGRVVRTGMALGVNYARTWSCYRGGALACGTCPSCVERLAAFRANGLKDPLKYAGGKSEKPGRKSIPHQGHGNKRRIAQ